MTAITKEAWNTAQDTEDKMDAIRFVSVRSKENVKSSSSSNSNVSDKEESNEPDYDEDNQDQLEEEQQDEPGEMKVTTNQVF